MSKEKNIQILHYVDGVASKSERKAVETWSKESKSNARVLSLYQDITEESKHLKSYNPVDTKAEWNSFRNKIQVGMDDRKLLKFLDGYSDFAEKREVERWASQDPKNKKDLESFEVILKESAALQDFKKVDNSNEWASFQNMIKDKKAPVAPNPSITTSTIIPSSSIGKNPVSDVSTTIKKENIVAFNQEKNKSRITPIAQKYAIAASVALFLAAAFWFFTADTDPYNTYATQEMPESFILSDGSEVALGPHSTLKFPKEKPLRKMSDRKGYIQGNGEFRVVTDAEKPFIIESNEVMGVLVLGTTFIVSKEEPNEIIENIEGSVRAYSLEEESIYVDLQAGDKYSFNGKEFTNMNLEIPVVDNSQEYEILYVLDYLMKESNWKVISAPNSEFDGKAIVLADLDLPYKEILDNLQNKGVLDYVDMSCEGCYMVTRFVPMSSEIYQ